MIISINGTPGSGKSTIAKKIALALGYTHYYMGAIRRDTARKKGMTLAEYNAFGEIHPETDLEVDEYLKKLGSTTDNFVIESRTSWYLLPQSIKIFITVDPKIGATRVYKELQTSNHRNEDQVLDSISEVLKSHKNRMASDKLRYKKYYNIDYADPKNFDFIIDTTNLTPDEVLNKTLNFIKEFKQNA
jgi:predicted cytidylate kinase